MNENCGLCAFTAPLIDFSLEHFSSEISFPLRIVSQNNSIVTLIDVVYKVRKVVENFSAFPSENVEHQLRLPREQFFPVLFFCCCGLRILLGTLHEKSEAHCEHKGETFAITCIEDIYFVPSHKRCAHRFSFFFGQ